MKKYIFCVFLIVAIGVSIFFRVRPAFLPSTKNVARASAFANFTNGIREETEKKLKDLPKQVKFRAIEDLTKILLKEQKKEFNAAVRDKEKEIKSYWQDERGQTFLLEIDPYHWLRLVEDIDRKNQNADLPQSKKGYDNFMLAPEGVKTQDNLHQNFHIYFTYFIFRALRLFSKNIPLTSVVFYMPVFISTLAVALVFFFCVSIRKSKFNIGGFFAGLSLAFVPVFLQRSLAGWFDTDPYVILFSLLSVWMLFLGLKYSLYPYKAALFTFASGLSIGLFSFTWEGWWYIFDLLVISVPYYILNCHLTQEDKNGRNDLRLKWVQLFLFIIFSLFFVGISAGTGTIFNFISGPAKIIFTKGYLQNQFWPNAFLTVSELRETNLTDILNQLGGISIVFVSIIYLIVMVIKRTNQEERDRQFIGFLFFFWILIVLYISIKAVRFSLLAAVPCAVSLGLFSEDLINSLSLWLKPLKSMRYAKEAIFTAICVIFMFVFYDNTVKISNIFPMMNRDWWEVLNTLKTETPQEAIINSWWDYGHWFKAVSRRRVIFDGATQNTPLSYWMGRALLADNEKEAYGILRMLNSGSNRAFEELEKLGMDRRKCIDVLNSIILLKKNDADMLLSEYVLNKDDREGILSYTHNPQAAYLIIEPSLIFKMPSISFLGNWDFKKADIYRNFKSCKNKDAFVKYLTEKEKYSRDDAANMYDELVFLSSKDALGWISSPFQYYTESRGFRKEDNLLLFDNGFVVDINNYRSYFDNVKKNIWNIPKSIFYVEDGLLKEKVFNNSDMNISALLVKEEKDYRLISLDPQMAKSVFTRLYHLNGLGLKYFHPVIKHKFKHSNDYIIVYKIDWNKDN